MYCQYDTPQMVHHSIEIGELSNEKVKWMDRDTIRDRRVLP